MNASKLTLVSPRRPHRVPDPSDHSLLIAASRRQVGRVDITELADILREAMVREALERACGNITHASDLLGITRQAVQQLIRRFELVEWHQNLRAKDGVEPRPVGQLLPLAR
jgi:transcriptional regulator of acetoin/glycerol metabolism